MLLTCNNSRGYRFPPLPNMTPDSSPGSRAKLETELPNRKSNVLLHDTLGTWKCLSQEGTKGNSVELALTRKSTRFLGTLCFLAEHLISFNSYHSLTVNKVAEKLLVP